MPLPPSRQLQDDEKVKLEALMEGKKTLSARKNLLMDMIAESKKTRNEIEKQRRDIRVNALSDAKKSLAATPLEVGDIAEQLSSINDAKKGVKANFNTQAALKASNAKSKIAKYANQVASEKATLLENIATLQKQRKESVSKIKKLHLKQIQDERKSFNQITDSVVAGFELRAEETRQNYMKALSLSKDEREKVDIQEAKALEKIKREFARKRKTAREKFTKDILDEELAKLNVEQRSKTRATKSRFVKKKNPALTAVNKRKLNSEINKLDNETSKEIEELAKEQVNAIKQISDVFSSNLSEETRKFDDRLNAAKKSLEDLDQSIVVKTESYTNAAKRSIEKLEKERDSKLIDLENQRNILIKSSKEDKAGSKQRKAEELAKIEAEMSDVKKKYKEAVERTSAEAKKLTQEANDTYKALKAEKQSEINDIRSGRVNSQFSKSGSSKNLASYATDIDMPTAFAIGMIESMMSARKKKESGIDSGDDNKKESYFNSVVAAMANIDVPSGMVAGTLGKLYKNKKTPNESSGPSMGERIKNVFKIGNSSTIGMDDVPISDQQASVMSEQQMKSDSRSIIDINRDILIDVRRVLAILMEDRRMNLENSAESKDRYKRFKKGLKTDKNPTKEEVESGDGLLSMLGAGAAGAAARGVLTRMLVPALIGALKFAGPAALAAGGALAVGNIAVDKFKDIKGAFGGTNRSDNLTKARSEYAAKVEQLEAEAKAGNLTMDQLQTQKRKAAEKIVMNQKSSTFGGINVDDVMGTSGWVKHGSRVNMEGLNPTVRSNFEKMSQEYFEATGKKIRVNTAFRTTEEQQRLWDQASPADRGKKVARPGRSMHEYGMAIDIQSEDANALAKMGLLDKYKFSRPVRGEAWHLEPKNLNRDAAIKGIFSADMPMNQDPSVRSEADTKHKGGGSASESMASPVSVSTGEQNELIDSVNTIDSPRNTRGNRKNIKSSKSNQGEIKDAISTFDDAAMNEGKPKAPVVINNTQQSPARMPTKQTGGDRKPKINQPDPALMRVNEQNQILGIV